MTWRDFFLCIGNEKGSWPLAGGVVGGGGGSVNFGIIFSEKVVLVE